MSEHIQIGDISPRIQYIADGAVSQFSYPFPIFEAADLIVYLDTVKQTVGYAASGAGQSSGGAVTFDTPPADGVMVTLSRMVPEARTTDFQEGGAFRAKVINEELDRVVCMVQQVRDDLGRGVSRPVTSTSTASLDLPDPAAGKSLKWNQAGNALENSAIDPDALGAALQGAEAARDAAQVSETHASASAVSAAGSAVSSGNDAAAVAAALAAFGDGKVLTIADSMTLTPLHVGAILAVNASAADVTITLPLGADVGEPWSVHVKKADDTTHKVMVQTQGTDTIDGATDAYELASQNSGARFAVDLDVAPDDWASLSFGAAVGDATPVGTISSFAGSAVPTGYLECNGAGVSRTTYADLFAAIGTTYGAGDGSTTFNLPDFRGEFLRGWDNGRGVDAGRTLGSWQDEAIKSHDHDATISEDPGHVHTAGIAALIPGFSGPIKKGMYPSTDGSYQYPTTGLGGAHGHTITFEDTGDIETRPRNVAVIYGIKAFNAVTNQAMVELGDLANDVSLLHTGKQDKLQFFHAREEQPSGTPGGASAVGRNHRKLNTVVTNNIAGASLADDAVTLPVGTYKVRASAPSLVDKGTCLYLYNVSDDRDEAQSPNGYSAVGVQARSYLTHILEVTGEPQTYGLDQHFVAARASNGLGVHTGASIEIYADIFIERLA